MATATELALELVEAKAAATAARDRVTELEDRLAAEMTEKRLEVSGVGLFERRRKTTRKAWKHEDIQADLRRRIYNGMIARECVDTETGEAEDDIALTARVFIETANPTWRKGALENYGLDADEYSEVTYEPGYAIQVTLSRAAEAEMSL